MVKRKVSEFVETWKGKGDEKQDTQRFWMDLFQKVLGIEYPTKHLMFEKKVRLEDSTRYIDAYIPETKVLIEQKGMKINLSKEELQSGGASLTPYNQARRYDNNLPLSEKARWIICCNFQRFEIHDMTNPLAEPEVVLLDDLEKEYYRLQFLVDSENEHIRKEMEVSLRAGEIIGEIYDAFLKEYRNPDDPQTLKSLNVLCVRLVFCLYAEDSGLFGDSSHSAFHDYLSRFKPGHGDMRRALIDLFNVLNTPIAERDPYLEDVLLAFPYVNGGLFADRNIEIPRLNDEIATLLLKHASDDFDWSQISPTIFGAVFESTLNPQTRRSGGMHYTSIENIHKVIDPLFLDALREELDAIKTIAQPKEKMRRARAFQDKLASLKFLDPASGSGNFLTETFLSLRRLENEVIRILSQDNMIIGFEDDNTWIKVGIHQFYGIEINDFAVATATTALWIAESQMMKETENIIHKDIDFFPLKTYTNIVEGNALRMDWNEVIPASELNYIMGNPPFVGLSLRDKSQQEDMELVFSANDRAGRLDYVAAWYKKAAQYISTLLSSRIEVAFVSTNSIVQGEQAPILWKDLFDNHHIIINFAYRTFVWSSEASDTAHVHCVIIGFSKAARTTKLIYENDRIMYVSKINAYLIDADNIFIQSRSKAEDGRPKLTQGNKPWDGGFLILNKEEKLSLLEKYPEAESLVKEYIGSYEFINRKTRYCLWLKGIAPKEYRNIPEIMDRLKGVADVRRKTKTVAVQALSDTPMLFAQIRQPSSDYILVPETSSSTRKYIPMGFINKEVIASNSTLVAENASLSMFAILTSNVHMAWTRTICGRLKSDYRYSPGVYNNFPWPTPTDAQKAKIEKTAQAILDARNIYPDCSLADLYDEVTMPPELRKAHQENDKAVMEAYGFNPRMTETEIVAKLFRLYQELTVNERSK